jgi:small subunit ribosomal protein S8
MVSDAIGDLIIQLKNAGMVGKAQVEVPYSTLRHSVADKLAALGYVAEVKEKKGKEKAGKSAQKSLTITLAYEGKAHRISGVQRISKPGRRLYSKVDSIHKVKFGKGHLILSTPKGILAGEEAKEARVGGEQLFIIW